MIFSSDKWYNVQIQYWKKLMHGELLWEKFLNTNLQQDKRKF